MNASSAFSDPSARAGFDVHQFYRLEVPGAGSVGLADIFAFEGTRAIGEATKYTIQFTHPRHDLSLPKFEQVDIANDERFVLSDGITGRPVANRPYRIQLAGGQTVEGITNEHGETALSQQDVAQGIRLLLQNHKEA